VSNVLSKEKKQQVIALGRLGWSLRRIQRETGIRRETISAYLKEARVELRPPRGRQLTPKPASPVAGVTTDPEPVASGEGDGEPDSPPAKPASESAAVTPDSGPETGGGTAPQAESKRSRHASTSSCDPYSEAIEAGLSQGRNAKAIWQDLVDSSGFSGGYQTVKRFIRKFRGKQLPEARVVIETAPGEETQVDYGKGPMVRDAQSGKYRRTRLFALTLGYSRKSVRLLVFRSSSQAWAELHEMAFRRLGGVTKVVVLDNLREGVLQPDIYDPTLNPVYRDMLQHYNVVALPCRVRDPDRKGKVERSVGHAQSTPLKGKRFQSLEEAQAYLDHWETHWADTRIHGTTKRQVAAMFAEERPALQPLPVEPFRSYQYGQRTVNLDGCVEVEAAYYSVPPGWIGRRVQVQWDGRQVRLLDPRTGQLLREHLHQTRGRHRIQDEDRPQQTPLTTLQLLSRADKAGAQIGALCRGMHQKDGELAVRRILGVLSLAKKYGAATVDDACAAALEVGVCEYRFVRRYLERRPQLPLSLRQVDPLIRQLTLYRDIIDDKTKESEA
jgi:transposase